MTNDNALANSSLTMKMTSEKRAIDKIFRRRDRYEIPDWQREEVWSREQQQNLIDSILRGWKLPKFYFVKLNEDEIEVLDGQQRLAAIFDFFEGEVALSKTSAKEFGGSKYSELPQNVADRFDDFEIEYDFIEDADEKELKEFFQRLQQGLPLTSSEKLNSSHSKLRDFCREMAKHAFFAKKVRTSNKRYAHFDIMAKVAAIEVEGLETGLRYDDLKGVFEGQVNFSSSSNVAKRIKGALDYLNGVFPSEKDALLRNRTIVQSFVTLACHIFSGGKARGTEQQLHKFFEHFMHELAAQVELGHAATDPDYLAFQRTVNANVRSAAATRHSILLRKLLGYDPGFGSAFGPSVVAQSGIEQKISQLGESVATLVAKVNTVHAAKHGDDLIKATNKTSKAMLQLGKPIHDFHGYEALVDNLYFLFREGPGNRLDGDVPPSFIDVNTLRTELRHDVDHGEDNKVRAKRKKSGDTFGKYSGGGTPQTLDPDRFPLVQANLLAAVDSDLRALMNRFSK